MSYELKFAIYYIQCVPTNKYYIGVDSYYPNRISNHFTNLKQNKHNNCYLQRAYNIYGKENFKFGIIEFCHSRQEIISKEPYWISFYDSYNNGFNLTTGGDLVKHVFKLKIKRINKNGYTPEVRKRMSDIKKELFKDKTKHPKYKRKKSQKELLHQSLIRQGEKSERAKLTNENVKFIRKYIKENKNNFPLLKLLFWELAGKFKVSPETIRNIYDGRTFKGIE